MKTVVSTGQSSIGDGARAGRAAADAALEDHATDRVDFCQLFCTPGYEYEAVIDGIRSAIGPDAELIGCSSTGEFTAAGLDIDEGIALALVSSDTLRFFTGIGTGLEASVPRAVGDAVSDLPSTVDGHPYLTAITLHDGMVGVGERLALVTRRVLGPQVTVVGGAASDGYRFASTPVFRNETVREDAVAVALVASTERPPVAVGHGHEPISKPMEVTRAEGDVIHELDGRPAFEVLKDVIREPIREEYGLEIDDVEPSARVLNEILRTYEFGIDQGDAYKIRWPQVETTDGPIGFAVEIPEGTVLRVMAGSPESQLRSVRETVGEAMADAETPIAGAFVYDCACRSNILGDRFSEAIAAMDEELGVPFCGFETYGEMCLQMGRLSGFHNTSTAVMLLPE